MMITDRVKLMQIIGEWALDQKISCTIQQGVILIDKLCTVAAGLNVPATPQQPLKVAGELVSGKLPPDIVDCPPPVEAPPSPFVAVPPDGAKFLEESPAKRR